MQKLIILSLAVLIILSSCKLKDNVTSPQPPGTGDTNIKVVSPNGGETLSEGNNWEIQWTGTGTLLVRIQYSIDNGTSWSLVKDSLKNTGLYNWFPIPNVVSNQCRIRVSSLDGVSSAQSDQVFAIVKNSNKSLKITSPIGGETWQAGSSKQITWYSSGIDSVKIEYTINNWQSWVVLSNSSKNTGIYFWQPIPNTPTTLAKVRIRDAQDGVTATESPNPFQILPQQTIKVVLPNGGETIQSGTNYEIRYTSENIENVKIEYTINGGAPWNTIISSTPAVGSYIWTNVPSTNSLQCRIRISNATNNGTPSAVSDNNFTITSPGSKLIMVTSPNGGEKWAAGSTQNITWASSGITNVKIEYTITNGISWNTITLSTPCTQSSSSYTWTQIPNMLSENCRIRISDAQDVTSWDVSDNVFSITQAPSILVTFPNGGEVWASGSNQTIEYTSVNVSTVKIEYTTDGGASWITLTNSTTPTTGTYPWNNIPDLTSYQCKVRVSDAMYGSPSDISDNNFTITNQVIKSITLKSPVGGEVWDANTSKTITWDAVGVTNVKIEYTTNDGYSWSIIQNSIPNTGSYNWAVPNTQSTLCKVRVSDVSGNPSSVSQSTFTIKPAASIILIHPNGNEVIRAGEAYNITWTAVGIDFVKIEYTMNNGVTVNDWFTIVSSTPATAGSYSFAFPKPSTDYKVRISEAITGSPSATSAGTFTVLPKTSITVVTPNGGENWLVGEPYEIRWTSNNVQYVKIDLTIDGGFSWKNVALGINNIGINSNGLYNWNVDPTLINFRSDLCKIRVSEYDASNPNISGAFDESDGFFSIHPKDKLLRVVSPNGGENWDYNKYQRIEWTSAGIYFVKILYTLNNGMTWDTVSSRYPSTGAYDWNPPNIVSSLARIKIYDADDLTYVDESDSYFNLIAGLPFITIVTPNQNSTVTMGQPFTIQWNNSDEITSVLLEYSLDNGNTWNSIGTVNGPEKYPNTIQWTPPSRSNVARIRITDKSAVPPRVVTVSDVFIIN